jgi:23S rRNA (uracil1939-C5)-methyltransferase
MRKKTERFSTQPMSAQIEKFSHDGRGIARINGKTTFIEGALPGEVVTFQYLRKKSDFDEGRLCEVIEPSLSRAEPLCAHYTLCGGCSLQHLRGETQIHAKQTLLLELLARTGHCQPAEVLEPLTSALWHYRNKARLSVRYVEKKQATLVGFREKNNPRYITEINHCVVLNARVDAEIGRLRGLIDTLDDPHCIAQIEVAAGDEDVALIFRNVASLSTSDEEKIRQFAREAHFRIYLQPSGPDSVFLFYPENAENFLSYHLPVQKIHFQFHPTDFTQVNAALNQRMVTQALNLLDLGPNDRVLDLFCGLGNFSLPIARSVAHVIGIEGSQTMVERAKMNAENNNLTNTEFFCANLDDEQVLIPFIAKNMNKLLLDPPRTGALAIVKQIDKLNLKRIVYISCNPATLARDADILVNQHGYHMLAAGVMDMFPHTSHVESMALFVKE